MERIDIQKNILENMDHTDYARFLEEKGYRKERLCIDETSEIVSTQNLVKGNYGTVIDIRCPSMYKIAILGRNQLPKDASSDMYENLHTFVLKLTDQNDVEIAPDTRIRIIKEKASTSLMICETMFYKDVAITEYMKVPPNKTKPFEKLYRFNDGIEMNGEDHLKVAVVNPNINIDNSKTKFSLDIDLWEVT